MFICPQGLIFVVDSNDPERIKEAADELHRMVKSSFPTHLLLNVVFKERDTAAYVDSRSNSAAAATIVLTVLKV